MGEKNIQGLDSISDDELEGVAGGWIVDMGPQEDERYNRYAFVDHFGDIHTYTSTLEDAQYVAHEKQKKGTTNWYNDTVITPEQYEQRFGHPFEG